MQEVEYYINIAQDRRSLNIFPLESDCTHSTEEEAIEYLAKSDGREEYIHTIHFKGEIINLIDLSDQADEEYYANWHGINQDFDDGLREGAYAD